MLAPAFSSAQGPFHPSFEKGKIMARLLMLCIGLLVCSSSARAQLDQIEKRMGFGGESALSDSKVASGSKDALRVGTDNAVKLTGKTDGYFGNEAIKILMPSNLRSVEKGLRAVGYGPKVDDFILSMNRSAEAAAPAARKIFVDAILALSFHDPSKILSGSDTAATDYFKGKTTDDLSTAFRPIVATTMD